MKSSTMKITGILPLLFALTLAVPAISQEPEKDSDKKSEKKAEPTSTETTPVQSPQSQEVVVTAAASPQQPAVLSLAPASTDSQGVPDLEDESEPGAVEFGYVGVVDLSRGARLGTPTRKTAYRNLQDFSLAISPEKFSNWKGATFLVNFQGFQGRNGSSVVGDYQSFSNIDDDGDRFHLYEAWFEQTLFSERVRLKAGQIDANSEFAFVENGGEFLNSSMGFSPTIFVMPTYPAPRASINLFLNPVDHFYVNGGFYTSAGPGDLQIGEVGSSWALGSHELAGRLGFGVWRHTGTFDRFDGGVEDGTRGTYIVFDQLLWQESPVAGKDPGSVGFFFQYGNADESVSELKQHIGSGISWTGALPGRDSDVLGAGFTKVMFSQDPLSGFDLNSELALELFYKIQLTEWLNIGPDVQFISNRGGVAPGGNVVVGTVRIFIEY